MNKSSITYRLISALTISTVLMCVIIIYLANNQLKLIIDNSQKNIYKEKVDNIYKTIKKKYSLLLNTGMVESYENDFKINLLISFQQLFYTKEQIEEFPFIINTNNKIVLHPKLYRGDNIKNPPKFIKSLKNKKELKNNYFFHTSNNNWYIAKFFKPWNWILIYKVPLDVKYADLKLFLFRFFVLVVIFTLISIIIISEIIKRITKPILGLAQASQEMTSGNLNFKLNNNVSGELKTLTNSFESMRRNIKLNISELKSIKTYLRNIIDSLPSIIISIDKKGIITNINNSAKHITNIKINKSIGLKLVDLFPFMNIYLDEILRCIKRNKVFEKYKIILTKQNKEYYYTLSAYPLINKHHSGAVIRLDNITEKIQLEDMMIQSEKMLSVGGLAAGMAHEINNPLAGILQNIQTLESRLFHEHPVNIQTANNNEINFNKLKSYLIERKIDLMIHDIKSSGLRAANIVNNMLSFARKENGKKINCSIKELLDKTLELCQNDYNLKQDYDFKKIKIIKKYASRLPDVLCEPGKIQQVFFNIIKNAAEAMYEKPSNKFKPQILLKLYQKNDMINIEIIDNGPGLSDKIKKRIFEPFFSTKVVGKGTGLGMSVSYFIIAEDHNGKLSVESKINDWTKFIISLPL